MLLFGSVEKSASDGVPELRDAAAANNITIAATRRPVPALIGPSNPILVLSLVIAAAGHLSPLSRCLHRGIGLRGLSNCFCCYTVRDLRSYS